MYGRRCRKPRRLVDASPGQQRPGNARHLVGECNGHDLERSPRHPHSLVRDTGEHGRYIIEKFETEWLLKLGGELIGRFKSPDEARACAEAGVKTAREVEEHL
jgi:hypothetical protein